MLRYGVVPLFVKKLKTDKLEPKSDKGRFMGYPSHSKGYYFYFLSDQRILII